MNETAAEVAKLRRVIVGIAAAVVIAALVVSGWLLAHRHRPFDMHRCYTGRVHAGDTPVDAQAYCGLHSLR